MDAIDDEAKILDNVNCISKSNNMICGFNTDKYGFDMLLNENGIDIDVVYSKNKSLGIDTVEDYVEIKKIMEYKIKKL